MRRSDPVRRDPEDLGGWAPGVGFQGRGPSLQFGNQRERGLFVRGGTGGSSSSPERTTRNGKSAQMTDPDDGPRRSGMTAAVTASDSIRSPLPHLDYSSA
ncbi:hypothetical protein DPEC_G00319830 [Dallia pectoralis]|uniref:Uncharacterized protein n=1 Tax=Dallia pectoralis TaxID=75939 RepID=A0ACC2F9K7_DALPE|nr:hypothetical protein DPEC_G00319830 [Dallia pectoralis]